MPRVSRAERDKYGETKQRYMLMLTETASAELDKMSDELGITRSEVIERVIRGGGLKIASTFESNLKTAV